MRYSFHPVRTFKVRLLLHHNLRINVGVVDIDIFITRGRALPIQFNRLFSR